MTRLVRTLAGPLLLVASVAVLSGCESVGETLGTDDSMAAQPDVSAQVSDAEAAAERAASAADRAEAAAQRAADAAERAQRAFQLSQQK